MFGGMLSSVLEVLVTERVSLTQTHLRILSLPFCRRKRVIGLLVKRSFVLLKTTTKIAQVLLIVPRAAFLIMEIFMTDIHPVTTKLQLQVEIGRVLHQSPYSRYQLNPINFEIFLFPPKGALARTRAAHAGIGALTLPREDVGQLFLREYGLRPVKSIFVEGRRIKFALSRNPPRAHIVENLRRLPYLHPEAVQEKEALQQEFRSTTLGIQVLQFGWESRDGVFSVEWEKVFQDDCTLLFSDEKREIRVEILQDPDTSRSVVIPLARIQWSATGHDEDRGPVIFISLNSPPNFELKASAFSRILSIFGDLLGDKDRRERDCSLYPSDADHIRTLPFTSIAIRLVTKSDRDLTDFTALCRKSHIYTPKNYVHKAEHRNIFSQRNMDRFEKWLGSIPFPVAFQLESLLRLLVVDVVELLGTRAQLQCILNTKGPAHVAALLRSIAVELKDNSGDSNSQETFDQMLIRINGDFSVAAVAPPRNPLDGVFDCFHVAASPTTMALSGPLPERSNRIMRAYANHHDSFLRVSFVEENHLQFQSDRDIDTNTFIDRFIRRILHEPLHVAGRDFHFLAYSQSALKSHTVWFVKDFVDDDGTRINAAEIIRRLGTFNNLPFDPQLMYCPARYGARISQAFTATDASVRAPLEEIFTLDDIKTADDKWCFTDGVGTMSLQLARNVWRELRKSGKRSTRRATHTPRAFQVRFMGSKGMLSVDYKLSGRAICLRPSMIKFESPDSLEIEVAQAFYRPGRYYLNRPLIMILENLGIRYEVFEDLQRAAVQDVERSTESFTHAAMMLEQYGLGTSFRLPSVLLSLAKLGLSPPQHDDFYQQMLEFAIHHILRDLKHHARIPVPNGYTLVGVADIHGYLKEGEIFACVSGPELGMKSYLQGPTLVSRSPTIHPGDVQVVNAIGPPPPGSPFAREGLQDTLVFSTKGSRPLPSFLGGGDLDGDTYNVTTMKEMIPVRNYQPAAYDPAPKKLLNRLSTMADVADFVADYVVNDVLGLVASTWLMIADQSTKGIFDPDCLTLGQLHSDAVDYPKSGQPVAQKKIPRLQFTAKPDWSAPETVDLNRTAEYYQSTRAIGRLFRDIDLATLKPIKATSRTRRRQLRVQEDSTLDDIFAKLCLSDTEGDDPLYAAVQQRVSEYIETDPHTSSVNPAADLLARYAVDLQSICSINALQRHPSATLSEEEAIIGTIVAKCPQKRRRRDAVATLREQTSMLVKEVRRAIAGDDDTSHESWLQGAWAAWRVSRAEAEFFGSKSFGWIALGEIFDAIRAIEGEYVHDM